MDSYREIVGVRKQVAINPVMTAHNKSRSPVTVGYVLGRMFTFLHADNIDALSNETPVVVAIHDTVKVSIMQRESVQIH